MSVRLSDMDSPSGKRAVISGPSGTLTLWYSYETVIGFQDGNLPRVVSENLWSTTTGKHLNAISIKKDRIKRAEFERLLAAVMAKHIK